MELLWVPISMLAALMQAVRTAAQKALNARLSTWMTTYVRSVFGLPFMLVYLWVMVRAEGIGAPAFDAEYLGHCAGALLPKRKARLEGSRSLDEELHRFVLGQLLRTQRRQPTG